MVIPKRIYARQAGVLVGALFALLLTLMIPPTQAQGQGYPGTTQPPANSSTTQPPANSSTTQPPANSSTTQPPANSGQTRQSRTTVLSAGESRTLEDCGFRPNTSATLTFNGAPANPDSAEADGCIRVSVRSGSSTRGDSCLVFINGQEFVGRQGDNLLVIDGTGSNGEARTITHTLSVSCAGNPERAGIELPRTGGGYLAWAFLAVGLIAIGAVAVLRERRRLARR